MQECHPSFLPSNKTPLSTKSPLNVFRGHLGNTIAAKPTRHNGHSGCYNLSNTQYNSIAVKPTRHNGHSGYHKLSTQRACARVLQKDPSMQQRHGPEPTDPTPNTTQTQTKHQSRLSSRQQLFPKLSSSHGGKPLAMNPQLLRERHI